MHNNYRKVGIVDTENGGIKFVTREEAGEHLGKTAQRLTPVKPEKAAKKETHKRPCLCLCA
jgi:hypothetical protein